MKKYLLFCMLFIMAASTLPAQSNTDKTSTKNNSIRTNSSETTDYSSRIYNSCAKEWVKLTGTVTYSIKEMQSDNRYFITYDIDLSKIKGVGETSGTVYKGGGHIKDKVAASFKNNHVVGNDKYRVKYKAANSSITITEHAHYVMSHDETKVSFNDAVESCE